MFPGKRDVIRAGNRQGDLLAIPAEASLPGGGKAAHGILGEDEKSLAPGRYTSFEWNEWMDELRWIFYTFIVLYNYYFLKMFVIFSIIDEMIAAAGLLPRASLEAEGVV